jgi:hypothetical protein
MSGTTRLRQGGNIVNIEGEIYNQLGRREKKAFDIEKETTNYYPIRKITCRNKKGRDVNFSNKK